MREIDVREIRHLIAELCIRANTRLSPSQIKQLEEAAEREISPVGKSILGDMLDNLSIAEEKALPICQDTGMAVVFADIGQDVHLIGGDFEEAVNKGVRIGYDKGFLRKSVVSDPLRRVNSMDNTPCVLHTRIVPGEKVKLTLLPKGFGSENTSSLKMLKPADGIKGVENFIVESIIAAAPNACAPVSVGVGIGGTFEKAAIESKRALTLSAENKNPDPLYRDLEERIKERVLDSGIGPMGLGGIETILNIHIIPTATHIAGLPVAVNICCWVDRLAEGEI